MPCGWCGSALPPSRTRWCSDQHRWLAWDAAHPRSGRRARSAPHRRKRPRAWVVVDVEALARAGYAMPNALRIQRAIENGVRVPGVRLLT